MRGFLDDLRYAFRQMTKSPGFAAVAIITLALGIGANSAVFSVIDAVMLRPLPYDKPERLINAQSAGTQNPAASSLSYPDFFDWRTQNRTLEHLVSYHDTPFTLTGLARPVHVEGEVVSWDLLPALGVDPELGRGFTADEEKPGTKVALISHALWVEQFAADKSILGRTIKLSGDLYTVIGVMPPSFRFPMTAPQTGVWTTIALDDDPSDPRPMTKVRGAHFLNTIGRMKPGVTVAQVDQDLKRIAGNLAKQYPDSNSRHDSARVETELAALLGDTRTALSVVLGAVALVLLIACSNIANLLLARMRERQREMAMRSALGAGRNRIIRQLLVESLVLSTVGGLAGCALAYAATPAMLRSSATASHALPMPVLMCGYFPSRSCLSFLAGLVFGIVPAITASKRNPVTSLKEGGRTETSHRDWFRSSLIVGQVAVGLVLTAALVCLLPASSTCSTPTRDSIRIICSRSTLN